MVAGQTRSRGLTWRDGLGRALVALSAAGVFYSFIRFGPAALASPDLTDYTKNHIVRELMFGSGIGIYAIALCAFGRTLQDYWVTLAFAGLISVVFWAGAVSGYGTAGMEQVWQSLGVTSRAAYDFHVPQTVVFVIGALLMHRPTRTPRPMVPRSEPVGIIGSDRRA